MPNLGIINTETKSIYIKDGHSVTSNKLPANHNCKHSVTNSKPFVPVVEDF